MIVKLIYCICQHYRLTSLRYNHQTQSYLGLYSKPCADLAISGNFIRMLYSTRHIAGLFGVSSETVRSWSNTFARHLSISATPSDGRHRTFTEDDLKVFALIKQMKERGLVFDEIQIALENGQRGDPPLVEAKEMVSAEGRQQITLLQREIVRLETEREALAAALRPTQDENVRLKALLERSETELHEARQEIRKLERRLGRFEGDED